MGALFSGPPKPQPLPLPPALDPVKIKEQQMMAQFERQESGNNGRASTILTGQLGASSSSNVVRTLGG